MRSTFSSLLSLLFHEILYSGLNCPLIISVKPINSGSFIIKVGAAASAGAGAGAGDGLGAGEGLGDGDGDGTGDGAGTGWGAGLGEGDGDGDGDGDGEGGIIAVNSFVTSLGVI